MKRLTAVLFVVVMLGVLVSCAHQRKIAPEQNTLASSFSWYASPNPNGSSSVSFVLGGKLIYIDPVIVPELQAGLPKADIILVTHKHLDHYSVQTIKALSGPDTQIAGIWNMAVGIKKALPVLPGETLTLGGLDITTYPAYNSSHIRSEDGLAFAISDGVQTVFISGDTDMQSEFSPIRNIDVAVFFMDIPVTLSPADAFKLAKGMKPSVIIPVHSGLAMEEPLKNFTKRVSPISQVRILKIIEKR